MKVYQAIERRADGTERVRFTCNDKAAVERAVADYQRQRPRGYDGYVSSRAPSYSVREVTE